MKRTGKVRQRLEDMSAEEMAQRWVAMRPRYLRFLGLFLAAAVIMFMSNHYLHFAQGTLNIVNVAFQICCVFVALFAMLTLMSFIFGRAGGNGSHNR